MKGFQKILAPILIIAVIAPWLVLPAQKAEAGGLAGIVWRAGELPTSFEWIRVYILRPLTQAFFRAVLVKLQNQVIGWVQGGGGKNVGFVRDIEKEFLRLLDVRAGEFLNNLAKVNLCGNIVRPHLNISLKIGAPVLQQRLGCSLTSIVKNTENFFNNFEGGWPAFFRLGLDLRNNQDGAYFLALEQKIRQEAKLANSLNSIYQANSGFLGFRVPYEDCIEYEGAEGGPEEICTTLYTIKTPGDLISDQLSKVFGTSFDFALTAKDFDELLGFIITQLINKLIAQSIFGGEGLFSSGLSSVPPPAQNNGTFIAQAEKAASAANSMISSANQKLDELKAELAQKEEELKNTADPARIAELQKEIAELKDKIAKIEKLKAELETIKSELESVKQNLQTATDPNVVSQLAQRLTELQKRMTKIGEELNELGVNIDPLSF